MKPQVWGASALAAAFYLSGADQPVSDWASSNTPVYGSQKKARDASDFFRNTSRTSYYASMLLRFGFNHYAYDRIIPGVLGISGNVTAEWFNQSATSYLKRDVGRNRPNHYDTKSFPSGHTSSAAVYSSMATCNYSMTPLTHDRMPGIKMMESLLAAGTAWGRVEGKCHYASDVLAGYALGQLSTAFFHELFHVQEDASIPLNVLFKRGEDGWLTTMVIPI